MSGIVELLNKNMPYIAIGMFVIILILLILIIICFSSLNSLEKRYKKLMRGVNNKNIEELVVNYLDKIDEVDKKTDRIKELYSEHDIRIKGCMQKLSMLRYRAFEDVGSDLSFSIALLDERNDGVIITGIYGRNESITYAKPIDKGISRYDLSEEEEQVLEDAMMQSGLKDENIKTSKKE